MCSEWSFTISISIEPPSVSSVVPGVRAQRSEERTVFLNRVRCDVLAGPHCQIAFAIRELRQPHSVDSFSEYCLRRRDVAVPQRFHQSTSAPQPRAWDPTWFLTRSLRFYGD